MEQSNADKSSAVAVPTTVPTADGEFCSDDEYEGLIDTESALADCPIMAADEEYHHSMPMANDQADKAVALARGRTPTALNESFYSDHVVAI